MILLIIAITLLAITIILYVKQHRIRKNVELYERYAQNGTAKIVSYAPGRKANLNYLNVKINELNNQEIYRCENAVEIDKYSIGTDIDIIYAPNKSGTFNVFIKGLKGHNYRKISRRIKEASIVLLFISFVLFVWSYMVLR